MFIIVVTVEKFIDLCRYIFVEFKNADDALFALSAMHGHPFDAKHTFSVNKFMDIERYANLDETYVEPKAEEYQSKVSCSSLRSSFLFD